MCAKFCPAILASSSHSPFHKHTELCLTSGDIFASFHPNKVFLYIFDLIMKNQIKFFIISLQFCVM